MSRYRRLLHYLLLVVIFFLLAHIFLWNRINPEKHRVPVKSSNQDEDVFNRLSLDLHNNTDYIKDIIEKNNHCSITVRPSHIDIRNTYWQAYKDDMNEIIIYNAIYDDRPDTGILPVIRMLGVSKSLVGQIYCQIWYTNMEKPHLSDFKSVSTGRGENYNKIHYGQYQYTCELPGSYPIPSHVSIVTNKCQTSSVYMPIYLPVRTKWQHEFGICVAISFGEINKDQFIEWAEMNRQLGVTEINIYNSTISKDFDDLFKYYEDQHLVVVHQMPPPVSRYDKAGAKMGSPASLNDCMLRNMYRYRYVIISDFDEIIVPKMHHNYTELLAHIDKVYELSQPYRSYTFRNVYFLSDLPPDTSQPSHLKSLQYRKRLDYSSYLFAPKSFIDPRHCLSAFNHYCWVKFPNTPKKWTIDVDPKIAASHHYKKCNFNKKKCDEMMSNYKEDTSIMTFRDELINRTDRVREELNLR